MPLPTRSNTTAEPRGLGLHCRIGDQFYRLAAAPDRQAEIVTAPLQSERVNTQQNPEDFGNEFGVLFSRADFSGGEGLERAHTPEAGPRDATRYYDSRNVDVDDEGRLSLLHSTEQVEASVQTGIRGALVDGTLYWTDGTQLRATSNPEASSPTVSDVDPHAGVAATTVTDVVGVGSTVYASVGASINRMPTGGSWSTWHSVSGVDRLWSAKGRLLFAVGEALYELDTSATPTETLLVTLPAGHTWTDVAEAGTFVLAAATDGYVYAFTDDGSAFTLAGQTWLEGEVCWSLTSAWGLVLYGTGRQVGASAWVGRLYRATVGDDGVFASIGLWKRWGDDDTETQDRRPRAMTVGRDSIFVAVLEDADEVHLWRYDLATAGLHRSYVVDGSGPCRDLLLVDQVPWVFVDGEGVFRRSDEYADSGWLIGPLADHFVADDKNWAGVLVDHEALSGQGDSITVSYATSRDAIEDPDDTGWTRLRTVTSGLMGGELQLIDVASRFLTVKLTLTAWSDGSDTPELSAYRTRAYPSSGDMLLSLPVNVSDQLERPGRKRQTVRGLGQKVYATLAGVEGQPNDLELYATGERFRGLVEKVETPVMSMSWRGTPLLVSRVTFRGRRVVDSSASLSTNHVFGIGENGVGTFGFREEIT